MRRLDSVPAPTEEMETNPCERKSRRRPGGRFRNRRHGYDFIVTSRETELDRSWTETAKTETAEVRALRRSEDQPIGCRVAHRSDRTSPIVDRKGKASRRER